MDTNVTDLLARFHASWPPYVHGGLAWILTEQGGNANVYYAFLVVLLTGLVIFHSRAFSRPPPVPLKHLPKRPMVQFFFTPDDVTTTNIEKARKESSAAPEAAENKSTSTWIRVRRSLSSTIFKAKEDEENMEASAKYPASETDSFLDEQAFGLDLDNDDSEHESADNSTPAGIHPSFSTDLPDSFAPLLSSSQVDVKTDELPPDLLHAIQCQAEVRLRPGSHEIPLDMDVSRPQFILDVPSGGCRLSLTSAVGSDGFSALQDLDPSVPTTERSKPLVKHAELVLDPPLPLSNVAPTLIHFPTLFEDNFVPTLRRIQIVRFVIDFIISISSFIEKCLWIIETKCKIHLGKVRVTPVYKGSKATGEPDWCLQLAFSGHVLFFGLLPVPFISVVLPTFIIPQPHALLEKLLTKQPLASAKLRREYIDEHKIALAAIEPVEQWTTDVKVVGTPPAVGLDITLPGGVTVTMNIGLGRDSHAEEGADDASRSIPLSPLPPPPPASPPFVSGGASANESLSTFSSQQEPLGPRSRRRRVTRPDLRQSHSGIAPTAPYDANNTIPWSFHFRAKGSVKHDKMTLRLLKCTARQDHTASSVPICNLDGKGTFAIWKAAPGAASIPDNSPIPLRRKNSHTNFKTGRQVYDTEETPSVAAVLLFPEETTSYSHDQRMLTYGYAFDVSEDSCLDAISVSVGATHPMLRGATAVTAILESLYCYGSVGARENAILDPMERKRKRNILRHLPAIDVTCGVQNIYIPPDSHSYSDTGLTLFLPELNGGRLTARFLGGIRDAELADGTDAVYEGIKVIGDFEVSSLNLATQGTVKEFPELDIFEGAQLRTLISGIISGCLRAHLRPQALDSLVETTGGRNIFNPLEAYEIEFSESNLTLKMKEFSATLGHRRVIFPAESAFIVKIIESVVDMGFEGRTHCNLSWDFNGLSPILQVTEPDQSPEDVGPEKKQQVSLLISPLRYGVLSFHVSSVGGIQIQKAATSREDKEGLYDWKFFNALVSPDETSFQRILDVVHDKRTMKKLLQVVELINNDLHRLLKYALEQVWRAKEIFDAEGISDPKSVIPMYKMSRLITLLLTGDVEQLDRFLPIVSKVVHGEGLDVFKVKELLREYLDFYEEWAPEIDRVLRWGELMLGPLAVSPFFVEHNVIPLAEMPLHRARLDGIPSATDLYARLLDKPQFPLEPDFSNLVGRVAPYLTFRQIEFLLQARSASDWQQEDLRRLRYVFSVKRKVQEIAESYGGLSFLPQSFLVSVFLGEATRNSLRAPTKSTARIRRRFKTPPTTRGSTQFKGSQLSERSLFRSALSRPGASGSIASRRTSRTIPPRVIIEERQDLSEGEAYELGDSLLGPQDVAILLQSGLTSVMKSSTVVQLNQRMLLDLICSQPRSFAVAVLAEIGMPSGHGEPRSLTSALMALLEIDQTAFKPEHQVDMPSLLESWLPGISIPRREDYMAGGRWARQSYYDSLYGVSKSILDDAETYVALKLHVQRARRSMESDPIPLSREEIAEKDKDGDALENSKLLDTIKRAKHLIQEADNLGNSVLKSLKQSRKRVADLPAYDAIVQAYQEAFDTCSHIVSMDKYAFQVPWFGSFFDRNYDALMIKSVYDNVVNDTDNVRHWLNALRNGALSKEARSQSNTGPLQPNLSAESGEWKTIDYEPVELDRFFLEPDKHSEQEIVDAIIEATIYEEADREKLRNDPLVRLLIPNPPGKYNFTIVSAMGVITDGKRGLELKDAFERLAKERGVEVIRADTGTARSLEYNAMKVEDAIFEASKRQRPFGLLGYSQGCANILTTETLMLSGTPTQQEIISSPKSGLVCRQLLFSAANGSAHGPATEGKIQRLIVLCEEFFKYQQGYVSRALASTVLEVLNNILDSSDFHKFLGGVQVFLEDGCRAFWRNSQQLVSALGRKARTRWCKSANLTSAFSNNFRHMSQPVPFGESWRSTQRPRVC